MHDRRVVPADGDSLADTFSDAARVPRRPRALLPPGWRPFPDQDGPGRCYLGPHPGFQLSRFHAYEQPLPEFPAFTHINEATCQPGHRLHAHHHPEWEISVIVSGRAQMTAGGVSHLLQAGDLFITRPHEVHSGRTDPEHPLHDCAVGFDPARLLMPGLLPEPGDVGGALAEAQSCDETFGLFGRHVIHAGPGPEVLCQRILAELDALDGDPRRRRLCLAMVQALLVELIVLATRAGLDAAAPPAPRRRDLRELLAWIGTRLDEPPTLPEMAERIGLSTAHLVVVCRAELGRTPLEQVTEMRITEACRRLADPAASVTAIAHDLGFCSSQYFGAVFRRRRGCAPSAWRRRP